ncbi:MAG: haloacid dehalogenase-like hydrolase [Phycisphaeraceae bacterium]|nr:haloacid dehalogenase-like hydrolase [Phycisphaeraceae bacterium]
MTWHEVHVRYLLFDIDSTLIDTQRSGMLAMLDAGRELYGEGFTTDGVEYAGRLDPLIVNDLLSAAGVGASPFSIADFRAVYFAKLRLRLEVPGTAQMLPGVGGLLARLTDEPGVRLGLLTGNYEESGVMKLRACGIDPALFEVRVWGDESPLWPPCRDHLPPVGIRRFAERAGRSVDPATVTIIGDTPHDVRCGLSNGCHVLAVATGRYSAEALRDAGAELVMDDLSNTERVAEFLLRRGTLR